MFEFENYKNNLDLKDKHNIKNVKVDNDVIYRGDIKKFKKKSEETVCPIPFLAAAVLGVNNTASPLPVDVPSYNSYTDIDAQELYLSSKPTCYLILGKPGSGSFSLGEAISKKFNCIHVCPKNVIMDEIEQKSPCGLCMDFNMRHNDVCKVDIILPIILQKLESPSVKHRGYVISGLPLVTVQDKSHYDYNPMHGEESILVINELLFNVIHNLRKKPRKAKDSSQVPYSTLSSEITTGEIEPEEEEIEQIEEEIVQEIEEEQQKVELPKFFLDSCSDIIFKKKPSFITKDIMLLQQFQILMTTKMKPDIIMYLTASDTDLITKKNHKYLNYTNSLMTYEPFQLQTDTDLRWPSKYTVCDYTGPYNTHMLNPKFNCRLPINFEENSIGQLCNYRNIVHPFIEKKIKNFDPKSIIKLNACTSIYNIMDNVLEALLLMSIKPVLLPEPLYFEEQPEDILQFWKSVEELNVIHNDRINFRRYASVWYNRCPVELKNRQSVIGNPRFAVTFFKHIYLLSSLPAMISFCRNPRKFLQLRYLEPTCRIIIIGTKSSGKSLVAHCLSWIFDTPILCYKSFLETEKEKKYNIYARTILSEIIATIEDNRFEKWQSLEIDRYSQLEIWRNFTLETLKAYIPYLEKINEYMSKDSVEVPNEDINIEEEEQTEPDEELLQNIKYYKNILCYLPFLDDLEQCKMMIKDKTLLEKFAPTELTTSIPSPLIPVLGDKDVTLAISEYIVANELQEELEPTVDELMTEMIKIISTIDSECKQSSNFEQTYGKFIIDGFPSDLQFWDYLKSAKLLPDYTIALIENREITPELIEYYSTIEKVFKNYSERFMLANDPLIKAKLQLSGPPKCDEIYMKMILHHIVSSALEQILSTDAQIEIENPGIETELIALFTESVEKFQEDWDALKVKLEENSKCFIVVELENKIDIQIIEETLLNLRKSYNLSCEVNEDEDLEDVDDEESTPKDDLTYNDPRNLCEINIYCPVSYYDYGVLWEGKPEFSLKFYNKIHYFSKDECLNLFQTHLTKYQSYNKPYKKLPVLRICVIGCIGSGKTTVSKILAKELGLVYIDIVELINDYLMPKHFKKVGRRYENPFNDISFEDEAATDFQIGEESESLISDILSNETECRLMVHNYLERGMPIISILMQRLIMKLWFQDPFLTTGFILDGYPRLPNDVEDMLATFCIPDLIIELESSAEIALERLSPVMFKTWKSQLNEAKKQAQMKLDIERKEWMNFITKNVVSKLIVDEIINSMPTDADESVKALSTESLVNDPELDLNIYNDFIQEYPEPVDLTEWENPEDVKERIDARIESIYEVDDENIQSLKDILSNQRIKVVSVDSTNPIKKILRVMLMKLSGLHNRTESFLEQSYIINSDIAEMLLLEGFYFLSKFNRMCPVHLFENPQAIINTYELSKRKGKIFTVAHRSYIYFISSEQNVRKFRENPLKYIDSNAIKTFFEYPLRIGIIGGPKSGKSILAKKLVKRYGLFCLSKGGAIRLVLEKLPWTELACRIRKKMQSGEIIDYDLTMEAIKTVTINHRIKYYGVLFDGFPEFSKEAVELDKNGLYPTIIFYLSSDKVTALRNSQMEVYYDILKYKPPYSIPFIENRYLKWNENSYSIKNWVNNDYQNLYILNGNESQWQCLQNAINIIENVTNKIHYYLANVETNVVPVDVMCIPSDIFQSRMSSFKNLCPPCLRKNVQRHSGYPVNRKGIVQYKNCFYWVCQDHLTRVLKEPHHFLTSEQMNIPEIPAPVKTVNMSLVYEKGICVVTYADNLPSQRIVVGCNRFAASYHGNTYLFCSEKCLRKFLERPHIYYDIVVFKLVKEFPMMSLRQMPNLGYLEQTIGNVLTDACCSVNVLRPKYPGLSYPLSGLLYIALYLKTHNPLLDTFSLNKYQKAFKTFEIRCKMMLDVGLRLRSIDNPFANYPKCCDYRASQSSMSIPKYSGYALTTSKTSDIASEINNCASEINN